MVKTVFVNGTTVTPAFLNAINNPIFDGSDLDGHAPKITNASLSDTPGDIKPEWQNFRDALKVSAGAGLSASYLSGSVTLPTGAVLTVIAGVVGLAASTTNYVFVSEQGTVIASAIAPIVGVPLAQVLTNANSVLQVIDLRPRFTVFPLASAIKVFGGTGEEGDFVASGSVTLSQGYNYFRNFTVPVGATVTISQFARILCSGDVTIDGTVEVTPLSLGGGFFITSALNVTGGLSGSGPGAGTGVNLSYGGASYNYAAAPYGSGGASGFGEMLSAGSARIASGGKGGGGIWIEARGKINVTGTIRAIGEAGGTGSLNSGTANISGGGGGSGGLVLLSSLSGINLLAASSIDVRGGAGGAAVAGASKGGGGGGGGQIVLISPSNNSSGIILVAGGADGTTLSGGTSLGGGSGAGFGGRGGGAALGAPTATSGQLVLRNFRGVGI